MPAARRGPRPFLTSLDTPTPPARTPQDTSVIRNGQLLGVADKMNRRTVSTGSMATATVRRLQAQAKLGLQQQVGLRPFAKCQLS